MLVLPDNDVAGAAAALRYVLESEEWATYTSMVRLSFTDFEELNLPRDAPDRQVWEACQDAEAVLATAN